MAKSEWWITVLIFCCWWTPVWAALPAPDSGVSLRESGELFYWSDDSGRVTLDQLRNNEDAAWRPVNAKTQLPNVSDTPVWFRLRIAAPADDR